MALDIGLQDGQHFWQDVKEPSLWLEDDGYYWFLHPWFLQLKEQTGQYIDLYGGAIFADEHLTALNAMLQEIHVHLQEQPETWLVDIGLNGQKDMPRLLRKDEILNLLNIWDLLVSRAREVGRAVICVGD